jgi:hypothetical protein
MIINSFILQDAGDAGGETPLAAAPDVNPVELVAAIVSQFTLIVPVGTTSLTISTDENGEAANIKLWADPVDTFADATTASANAQAYSDNDDPNVFNESVTISDPAPGTWKIGVVSAGGNSSINITAELTGTSQELTSGTETAFTAPATFISQFTISVPFAAESLSITVDAPDANGIINLWADGENVYTSMDDASSNAEAFSDAGDGILTVQSPFESEWNIGVQLGGDAHPGHITATVLVADVTDLTSGTPVNFSGAAGDCLHFAIEVGSGVSDLSFSTDGVDGDVALWFTQAIIITDPEDAENNAQGYSDNDTPNAYTETVGVEFPDPAHYIATVYIKSTVSAGTITATVTTE